jgi:hypothetical protein
MGNYTGLIFGLLMMATPAAAENQAECQNKFMTLGQATGLVVKYEMRGARPVVVVNERMWNQIPFDAKTGLADTFDCAVAGPGKALMGVEYRSNLTDKVLARWNGLRLSAE